MKFNIISYKTALHLAVEKKYVEIIKLLQKNKGIDIYKKNGQDNKPN